MGFLDDLKDVKKLAVLIAAALGILIAAVIFLSPSGEEPASGGPEVIASKRIKIDLRAFAVEEKGEEGVQGKAEDRPKKAEKAIKAMKAAKARVKARVEAKKAVRGRSSGGTEKKSSTAVTVKGSPWAINVASFVDSTPARNLEKKISGAGYNAYVTEFVKDGRTWHRVRVGFFSTREEAKEAALAIGRKFIRGSEPWVVRPGKNEVAANQK